MAIVKCNKSVKYNNNTYPAFTEICVDPKDLQEFLDIGAFVVVRDEDKVEENGETNDKKKRKKVE